MVKERVLVTGGAGYIGCVLVSLLLAEGYAVTVVDNFMYKQTGLLAFCGHDGFDVVRGDVRDATLMKRLLAGVDAVVHLAAIVGMPACDRDPILATSVNLDAVKTLDSLRGHHQRLIYPVTNSGYGIGQEGLECTEESPLRPISLYGRTKVEAEKILLDSGDAITFRLATAFGASPRMRVDLLVNDFTYRAVTDRSIVLFEAHFKRNYVHVQDIARVFMFGLAHFERLKDQTYNVGLSNANLSKLELCHKIREHVPELCIIESEIGKDVDKRNYIVSNAKIEGAGFTFKRSLDDGIRELLKAYRFARQDAFTNL